MYTSFYFIFCLFFTLLEPVYYQSIEASSPYVTNNTTCKAIYKTGWYVETCETNCDNIFEGLIKELICINGNTYDWRKTCLANDIYNHCNKLDLLYTIVMIGTIICLLLSFLSFMIFIYRYIYKSYSQIANFHKFIINLNTISLLCICIYYMIELPSAELGNRNNCAFGPCKSFMGSHTIIDSVAHAEWYWGFYSYYLAIISLLIQCYYSLDFIYQYIKHKNNSTININADMYGETDYIQDDSLLDYALLDSDQYHQIIN